MPVLRKVYEDLDKEKYEIVSINVTVSDEPENAIGLITYYDLQFPTVFDLDGTVSESYGLRNIPLNMFIGADGIVVEREEGPMDEEKIMENLEKGLAD